MQLFSRLNRWISTVEFEEVKWTGRSLNESWIKGYVIQMQTTRFGWNSRIDQKSQPFPRLLFTRKQHRGKIQDAAFGTLPTISPRRTVTRIIIGGGVLQKFFKSFWKNIAVKDSSVPLRARFPMRLIQSLVDGWKKKKTNLGLNIIFIRALHIPTNFGFYLRYWFDFLYPLPSNLTFNAVKLRAWLLLLRSLQLRNAFQFCFKLEKNIASSRFDKMKIIFRHIKFNITHFSQKKDNNNNQNSICYEMSELNVEIN